jgi:hypothetical protein
MKGVQEGVFDDVDVSSPMANPFQAKATCIRAGLAERYVLDSIRVVGCSLNDCEYALTSVDFVEPEREAFSSLEVP